jgi:membrane fusion protein (multidrug efflux system)
MLRITIENTPTEQTWILQGRIVRPWATELRYCWKKAHAECKGRKCIVDLSEVTFIDEHGERMLAKMMNEGAEFVVRGLYAKDILERLKGNLKRRTSKLPVAMALLLLVSFLAGCANPQASTAPPPPPEVEVVNVTQKEVPIYGDWVATLDGYVNAQIQPQVSGYVVKQDYREGSMVRRGDVLFEIDPRPFQAVLDQAKGQLAQAIAQQGLAAINVKRDIPEAEARAIPQSQLDNDTQAKLAAEATIQANQAAVETAQLNLGFTKVRSLVDGIAGTAQIQVGNFVGPGSVLTTVSQLNPIKAYFSISELEYLHIADKIKPGAVGDLLRSNKSVPLQLILADQSTYKYPGEVVFADRQVNSQTGTIRITGSFPNPNNILRPGQFGRVRAVTTLQKNALLVPQRAVTELQGTYQVAVVGQDKKVGIRNVKVGDRVGSMWVIDGGLNPGDRVITEGVEKVRDGVTVNPKLTQPDSEGK